MNNVHRNKRHIQRYTAFFRVILYILLPCMAICGGIAAGNALSSVNTNVIEKISVESFKATLNSSLPVIDNVYNSGNVSVSFSGEIRDILKSIFAFDLNNPVTVLNANSSILHSYYKHDYQPSAKKTGIIEKSDDTGGDEGEKTVKNGDAGSPDSIGNNSTDGGSVTNADENIYGNPVTNADGNSSGSSGSGPADIVPYSALPAGKKQVLMQDASSISIDNEVEKKDLTNTNIVSSGKISIQNETHYNVNIEELKKQPLMISFARKGPKVLIYHTHTTESYIRKISELNSTGAVSRTLDPRYGVVRVGEELAQVLRKKFNIDVIHNGTVHDYPDFNSAYSKSLNTVNRILKSYPSIKIVLDIHRDATGNGKKLRVVSRSSNGKNAAQIMFVVATGELGKNHPNWRENLKLAIKLQENLNARFPGLAKPIYISKYRYNQHVSNGALVVEVGGDGNLLEECLESMKYLAEAVNSVVNGK